MMRDNTSGRRSKSVKLCDVTKNLTIPGSNCVWAPVSSYLLALMSLDHLFNALYIKNYTRDVDFQVTACVSTRKQQLPRKDMCEALA